MSENKIHCTLTDHELAAKADQWIDELIASGGKSWTMQVPARPNNDSDLIFAELNNRFKKMVTQQPPIEHTRKESVEEQWESFWKEIVCNPDGTINIEQVKKELHDFSFIMEQVPKIYMHITGGRMSKVMYHADTVITVADDYFQEQLEEAVKEEIGDPEAGPVWVKASTFKYVPGAAYHAKDNLSKGAGKFDVYGQFIWGDGTVTLPRDFDGLLILDESGQSKEGNRLPDDVVEKILMVRDYIAIREYDEAYHHLYSIPCPKFDSYFPWKEFEDQVGYVKSNEQQLIENKQSEEGNKEDEWDSERIIGRVKDRFKELEAKQWDWRSFYNGWLEGRSDMLQQIKEIGKYKPKDGNKEREVAFAEWLATERWQPRINTEWARHETLYSDISVKTTAELWNEWNNQQKEK